MNNTTFDRAGIGHDTFTGGVNSIRGSNFADVFHGTTNPAGTAETFEGLAGNGELRPSRVNEVELVVFVVVGFVVLLDHHLAGLGGLVCVDPEHVDVEVVADGLPVGVEVEAVVLDRRDVIKPNDAKARISHNGEDNTRVTLAARIRDPPR